MKKFYENANSEEVRHLLAEAAIPTYARIRQDRHRAPPRLRPSFDHLEARLFDSALNVNSLKRASQIRDGSIAMLFQSTVNTSPKQYISERRLETAARLLRDSPLKIWQIAELVGYSSLGVFSKAFNRWSGQRPRVYRNQVRPFSHEAPAPLPRSIDDEDLFQRAFVGALTDDEATRLIRRIRSLYPRA